MESQYHFAYLHCDVERAVWSLYFHSLHTACQRASFLCACVQMPIFSSLSLQTRLVQRADVSLCVVSRLETHSGIFPNILTEAKEYVWYTVQSTYNLARPEG